MAKRKRKPARNRTGRSGRQRPRRRREPIALRPAPGGEGLELVHPPCARRRADDIKAVRAMLEMGEVDVAVDELRWLLDGCDRLLEAHLLLGEIALAEGEVGLARGHFGYAYELVLAALESAPEKATLPCAIEANRAFHEAGRGLVRCLVEQRERSLAEEVARRLIGLDPGDPLGVGALLGKGPGTS